MATGYNECEYHKTMLFPAGNMEEDLQMRLISTRNATYGIDSMSAVLKGISDDGGLFVPDVLPTVPQAVLGTFRDKTYQEIAVSILGMFFELSYDKLASLIDEAYAGFDTKLVAPLAQFSEKEYILELFHGPTLAFKDMALQILPRLMSEALKKEKSERDVLILTATSGDTGKAALEGFRDVSRTQIGVFYPEDGVSPMQKLQMITQSGANTHVMGVKGNFDDAQTGVKNIFADSALNQQLADKGYVLSSANSINIGRLVPQIVYYFYSYAMLLRTEAIQLGDEINFAVPTGNFGNILACYYAKLMGLPVGKLICASNKNNVLTDFFDSGKYVAKRTFFKTISPSMDILISSNLERLLFDLAGKNSIEISRLMNQLREDGEYQVPDSMSSRLKELFYANFADDFKTKATISAVYREYGYLMDPHTAVAKYVYDMYQEASEDENPVVIVSTASPYKFVQDVYSAVSGQFEEHAFTAAYKLADFTSTPIPRQITDLENAEKRFLDSVPKDGMAQAVLNMID